MYQLPMHLNLQFKYMHACEVMHGSFVYYIALLYTHCYNIVVHVSACVQCVFGGAMTFNVCNTSQRFTLR